MIAAVQKEFYGQQEVIVGVYGVCTCTCSYEDTMNAGTGIDMLTPPILSHIEPTLTAKLQPR